MAEIEDIKKALTGITIARAKALAALAKSPKQYPNTNDIRKATGYGANQLGGMISALTKIEIGNKQLLTIHPLRPDIKTVQYIWHDNVATRHQVLKVLKKFGVSI